ncbi:MAG: hypothetical protein CLLPBCKN_002900 [Chroococcidiopsis cubana SAG 39.79]|jgi:hypothetical protein|nr:hypothetical protein [Chroococcidiopsis cubana SAG 39.79]
MLNHLSISTNPLKKWSHFTCNHLEVRECLKISTNNIESG